MKSSRLRQLELIEVVECCGQESERFRAGQVGEEGHCLELFRRAIEENDQAAWGAVYAQYRQLVAKWTGGRGDGDELIESTFQKFWRTLRGTRLTGRFKHIGAVMAYLRKCAYSVRLDLERQERQAERIALDERTAAQAGSVEEMALAKLSRDALCASVRLWLAANVQDEQEKLVIALSYELELSPAEIASRCPAQFAGAEDVYKIKERLLKRLRRAGKLRELFEG
jgi:DNA-directed RNA polymerase specialized sigma24 family protein